MRIISALLASSIFCTISFFNLAQAVQSDFSKPISVDSNKQIAELAKNKITFLDNVVIIQGSIEIHADKVEILRTDTGEVKSMTAIGRPATFKQLMDNGRNVNAQALQITYEPKIQTITLLKNAFIQQENSKLSSDKIIYNIGTEKMEAEAASKEGRVTTVFIPDQLKTQINDSKKNN